MIRPKVGVKIVHFDGPDLNVVRDRPIQTSAPFHSKSVVATTAANELAFGCQNRAVGVGVCSAEQAFSKWLQPARMLLDLGTEHVSEKIAACRPAISKILNLVLEAAGGPVAHHLSLNTNPGRQVVDHAAPAAIQVKAGDGGKVRLEVQHLITKSHFKLLMLREKCSHA